MSSSDVTDEHGRNFPASRKHRPLESDLIAGNMIRILLCFFFCFFIALRPCLPCLPLHFIIFRFLFPDEDLANQPEGRNAKALAVTTRVSSKLTGRDFKNAGTLDVPHQVQRLILQATSMENLCQVYDGDLLSLVLMMH